MTDHGLVIGAGPAGLSAAIRLASRCGTVTVVEARRRGHLRQPGEHLPPAGLRVLVAAGLKPLLDDPRHGESSGVRSAWGHAETQDRDYYFSLPVRGLNLDRAAFDAELAALAEGSGVQLMFDSRIEALEHAKEGYAAILRGPDGRTRITAGMVVDASGRRAVASRLLGARRRRLDQLVGITGIIEKPRPSDDPGRLSIEAVEDGWWYGVHRADGALVATYMTDAANVRAHPGGACGLWHDRRVSGRLIGPHLREAALPAKVAIFDASTQWLEPVEEAGFIAVGDAAAAYDPLSSWGIAKGVEDGAAGATALILAAQGQTDAPCAHARQRLASFERHCERRHEVYAAETRWPRSPFWQSRHGGVRHTTLMTGSEP